MKTAFLSVAAAAALALTAGTASAHPPGFYPVYGPANYHGGYGGYHGGYHARPYYVPVAPAFPVVPVTPIYRSGFSIGLGTPNFSLGIGSSTVVPGYGYSYGYGYPYSGTYRRW